MKKKIMAMLFVVATMCSFVVPAFAAQNIDSAELEEGLIPVQGEPIGTLEDDEGMLPNGENSTFAAGSLPFSTTANALTGMKTSRGEGNSFTGGAFDAYAQQGLLVKGRLTHTQGKAIKVGACYYDSNTMTYYSVKPLYFSSQVEGRGWIPKLDGSYLNFNNSRTYYGHITNYQGSGSVSGTLNFSVSQKP